MKKLLFLSLLMLSTSCLTAQIARPEQLNQEHQKRTTKHDYSKSENSDHVSGKEQSTFISSSFDPTWASRFQFVLDSVIAATGTKGGSAAIMVPGQGTWTGVSGISSENEPITSEMRFGIGSNTKLFLGVVLAKLQEDGVLSLDDPLSKWIPEYTHVDPSIKIRQLLKHETGVNWFLTFSFVLDSIWADTSRFWQSHEIVSTIGEPHFDPGNGFLYSNTNYLLAGMVIEAATGKSWVQNVRDFIFEPVDMDSTFVGAFEPRNGPLANEYDAFNDNIEITNSPMTALYSCMDGAGAIISTPSEMIKWYDAVFNGEIISETSLMEVLDVEKTSYYGLGIGMREYLNIHTTYGHEGGTLGYVSKMIYDKKTRSIISIVVNSQKIDNHWIDFNDIVIPLVKVFYNEYPRKENDAGITEVISPWESNCNSTVIPTIRLTNFGSNILGSVIIHYQIDMEEESVFNWSGSLIPGDTLNVDLPEITVGDGEHTFSCNTSQPNGMEDGYTYNNASSSTFIINSSTSMITMLTESFDSPDFPPEGWSLNSSSTNLGRWGQTPLARFSGSGSVAKPNYNDYNVGTFYDLNLPEIHVSEGTNMVLDFKYAYAFYPLLLNDSLQILVSNDCGLNWHKVFDDGGVSFATSAYTSSPFYPQTPDQWEEISIPLENFSGEILIKFRAINGASNNLFIDDVNVSTATDIFENYLSKEILVFPNPTTNQLTITGLPENSEFQLTDLTGNILMTQKASGSSTTINLSEFPKGIYFIRTKYGVKKIVKM